MEQLGASRFEVALTDRQRSALLLQAWNARATWNWALAARKVDYEERVKPARQGGEKVRGITWINQQERLAYGRDELFPRWAEVSAMTGTRAERPAFGPPATREDPEHQAPG